MNRKIAEFIDAYKKADAATVAVIESNLIGELIHKYKITKNQNDVVSEIANYLLSITPEEELLSILKPLTTQPLDILAEIKKLKPNQVIEHNTAPEVSTTADNNGLNNKQIGYSSLEEPTHTSSQDSVLGR